MTKDYQVCGLGNALVDLNFEVSNELLKTLNIDKGVMTLVDEARIKTLLEHLEEKTPDRACGGSLINAMHLFAMLGGRGYLSCRVAQDDDGRFYYDETVASGLKSNLDPNALNCDGMTGKCIVLVTPDAERTMNTFLGVSSDFDETDLTEDAITRSEYLFIEGYLVAKEGACSAAIKAREIAQRNGTRISLTLSDPNMVNFFKEEMKSIIGSQIDLIFCNEAEALLFCDTEDLSVAIERLKGYAKSFVITAGSRGSIIFDGQKAIEIPPHPVTSIDTVGAGDVFAGSFLYAITHGFDYEQAGDIANFAASRIVTQVGPRLIEGSLEKIKDYIEYSRSSCTQ